MRLIRALTCGGRATLLGVTALTAVALGAGPAAATCLDCDSIQSILRTCLGSYGGAEVDSCQPEVDDLALVVGPDPEDRLTVCTCIHEVEDTVLHYYPSRDIAALNHRLKDAGLYSWDCELPC